MKRIGKVRKISKKIKNKNSYKFFQNKSCEFFPCHKIAKQEDFNCLFCYCPIYSLKDKCGGDFEYLENGVKDCSNCTLPHIKDNYQIIVDRVSVLVDKVKINNPKYIINKLLIATQNKHKIIEFKNLFKNIPIKLYFLSDFKINIKTPTEPFETFKENAQKKAQYYSRKYNMPCISDDSGLVVECLDNFPGVRSARWNNNLSTFNKNNELIKLVNLKNNTRYAKYICALTFYDNQINFYRTFFGELRGSIAKKNKDIECFGYDSIFIVTTMKKIMHDLTLEEKNKISHRAKATQGFISWLNFFLTAD